jgi:hypothetical protein
MKTKMLTVVLVSTACVSALTACQEDKKARATQRVVEKTHDPGACPKLADGHYRLANQNPQELIPTFLDVSRNDGRELKVQFDGKETFLVNGKEQPKQDGTKFSLGCTANRVNVAGTDSKGQRTQFSLVPTDKGIDMNQSEPTKQTSHYEKTSALGTAIDKVTKPLDSTPAPSGIPSPDNLNKPTDKK